MTTYNVLRHGALGSALAAALALAMAATPGSPAAANPPARAAKPKAARPTRPAPASLAVDAADAGTVTLSLGTGQLVTLPRAISDVFVADDKIADVSPRTPTRLYIFGKSAGQTTLSATDRSGAVVYTATVRVGTNIGNVGQMLKMTLPDAQITATPMNGMMVLTGTVASPDDVEEANRLVQAFVGKDVTIVTRLKTATPLQVMLRVRFSEVNRNITNQIGFNFGTRDTSGSGILFGGSQGNAGTITTNTSGGIDSSSGAGPLSTLFGFAQAAAGVTSFGFAGHALGLDLLGKLDLAEANGLATTLAEPTLTAISGETASFLAGGEIPIPVPQYQGVTTIEYKQYGVSLAFTPTVLGDGRISLRVRPESSQLNSATGVAINGYTVPGITTRRTETTVELGSGQSFVIGGLLSNDVNNSVQKAPWLGDLPVIGQLFRSNSFKKSETELVIVVTPYLVKPVSDSRIALPTDGYRNPTDAQRVLIDRMSDSGDDVHRVKPVAEAPVTVPTGAPVASIAGDRRKAKRGKADVAAAPGFSIN